MNVNLELYKTFYYVAKNGNITRAANEMLISQPAISKSIKTLEDQMNTTLFIRKRDGVILTEAGNVLYKKIKNAMELIESAENDVDTLNSPNSGTINIGTSKTIIQEFLMSYIKEFHKLYPNVNIRVYTEKTSELIKKSREGLIDIILTNTPTSMANGFKEERIRELTDVLVVNSNYKELINKKITLEELINLPLLLPTKGTTNRIRFDDFCLRNNISITPKLELGSNTLIKEFTDASFGIGLLTKEYLKKELDEKQLYILDTTFNLNEDKKYLGLLYIEENMRLLTNKFIKFILKK